MPSPAPNPAATAPGAPPRVADVDLTALRSAVARARADPFAGDPLPAPARRARKLARDIHDGQLDRHGRPLLEHVERVAASVPPSARTVAFVHDVCERSGVWPGEVAERLDLDGDEREALVLLTKRGREPLLRHVRRVVRAAPDPARELALVVLQADIEDHAAHATDGDRPYATALAVLAEATAPLRDR
ncbi:hypothetical protein AB0L40_03335 [Patulibacter sp. NPDC049589]|uniref:hypothetical protein n=1 Tax=Patulibacter sp. NPDC049589 TaxID=3154731 RepID=UPI003415058F